MAFEHLCMGCMADKGGQTTCPRCGYVEGTQPEAPSQLSPRTAVNDRYLLGKVLGHGGFGITYLAWDMKLHVKLAVKEYMPHEFASRSAGSKDMYFYSGTVQESFEYGMRKFLEEARTLAQFNGCPGIVSVQDYFEENGTAYFVMSYVDGVTLEEYLKKNGGRITFDTALKIMAPVMDALREVHESGLLHRDISPDNIYITVGRHVKLLDFGAARQIVGERSKSLSVILKPGYAPMEQYYSRGKQGPWTDVYAAAATIYRAVTGKVPPESLERAEGDTIKPPSGYGVQMPRGAESVLMKALSVRREDRFATMKEFQDAIEGKYAGAGEGSEDSESIEGTKGDKYGKNGDSRKGMADKVSRKGKDIESAETSYSGGRRPSVAKLAAGAVCTLLVLLALFIVLNNDGKNTLNSNTGSGTSETTYSASPAGDTETVEIPRVTGMSIPDAEQLLHSKGLYASFEESDSKTVAEGNVIAQQPEAGERLVKRGTVILTVSIGTNEKIYFPDKNLEAVIRETIKKASGDIYYFDVRKVEKITADKRGISSFEGIQHLTYLKELHACENSIRDLGPLKNLVNLTHLLLEGNQITDISPLDGLTNLKWLELGNNRISDISTLKKLTNLEIILTLNDNQLNDEDLFCLKDLTALQKLDLRDNNIKDISQLKNLTKLKVLNLDNNQISDISILGGMIDLEILHLHLSNNKIRDISVLSGLTGLEELDVSGNPIEDYTPLNHLKGTKIKE